MVRSDYFSRSDVRNGVSVVKAVVGWLVATGTLEIAGRIMRPEEIWDVHCTICYCSA